MHLSTYWFPRLLLAALGLLLWPSAASAQTLAPAPKRELRAAWVAHYRLRALTLYDFEQQVPLTAK